MGCRAHALAEPQDRLDFGAVADLHLERHAYPVLGVGVVETVDVISVSFGMIASRPSSAFTTVYRVVISLTTP